MIKLDGIDGVYVSNKYNTVQELVAILSELPQHFEVFKNWDDNDEHYEGYVTVDTVEETVWI